MNQNEVWDNIASSWYNLRKKPFSEVLEFLNNKNGIILDIGCGTGRHFIKNKNLVGIDSSLNMLKLAKKYIFKNNLNVKLVLCDASSLPFKDNTFNFIIFIATLHCIEKEKREMCIQELKRVMKNNGEAMITVWNRWQPRFFLKKKDIYVPWRVENKKFMRYYHLFTKSEFKKLLKKYFDDITVFYGKEKVFKLFSKNIISIIKKRG
ncbi:MAG: methyltransferase domain-containing protein [Candidatus Aenigmatarchaeota archaeon]